MSKTGYFFKDKPLFGFDIGHSSLKVMQMDHTAKKHKLIGYGTTNFDSKAIVEGVIVDQETIAKAALDLFEHHLIGDIATDRVAIAIPTYRTYTRAITLPALDDKELKEAVEIEAAQYLPLPLTDVYLDYHVVDRNADKTELFAVAVPRNIVDSQLELMKVLGLETVSVAPTIDAAGQLFLADHQSSLPTVLVDFGSLSADITIFDKKTLVTGTVSGGGLSFTNLIRDKLHVSPSEAQIIKTKYGLGASKRQDEIISALDPTLTQIAKEIRRMIRYYEERFGDERKIPQIVTLGGGANMPGLSDYLTNELRMAVRTCDPWEYCDYAGLQPPSKADKPMYATVMGLSMLPPGELFV